jgi:hypothetical protein
LICPVSYGGSEVSTGETFTSVAPVHIEGTLRMNVTSRDGL